MLINPISKSCKHKIVEKSLDLKRSPDQIRVEISKLVQKYVDLTYAGEEFQAGITVIPAAGKVIDSAEIKNMVEA